jgi:hypothetical protein
MKNSTLDNSTLATGSDKNAKAPYAKPVLRTFGSVKNLTKGGGGSRIDGNGPSKDQSGF